MLISAKLKPLALTISLLFGLAACSESTSSTEGPNRNSNTNVPIPIPDPGNGGGTNFNEAALLAARGNATTVKMTHFEEAKDKVMLGVERKSMVITDRDRKITAYHESGHALVAYFTEDADPVHKVTIVPRGQALGVTAQLPVEDKYNYSKKYLLGRLDILMGGRCAEKIIFAANIYVHRWFI